MLRFSLLLVFLFLDLFPSRRFGGQRRRLGVSLRSISFTRPNSLSPVLSEDCMALSRTESSNLSRDDAMTQIWGLYRSGKQTKPDLALRPSSRYKSTKNHSKPVAPCPLESSTVHGDALNKAESSCVTKAATLGSFLSGQKYWFNLSTKMEVFPATTSSICDFVLNNRRSMPTMRRNTRKLGFPLVGLFLNVDPSVKHRPITKSGGLSPQFLKSRSVLPYLLPSPLYVMSRFLNLYGRRRYRRRSSTSMFWSCCYLLKILVKTESLSSGLSSFRALPFRFVPRFDIVDDLAKNAVWSMTLGTSSTL